VKPSREKRAYATTVHCCLYINTPLPNSNFNSGCWREGRKTCHLDHRVFTMTTLQSIGAKATYYIKDRAILYDFRRNLGPELYKRLFFFLVNFRRKIFLLLLYKSAKSFSNKNINKKRKKKIPAKGCLPDRWGRLRMVHTHKDP
jgi:hypothetical protein